MVFQAFAFLYLGEKGGKGPSWQGFRRDVTGGET